MSCNIHVDTRGFGTVGIADAKGKIHDYRIALVPRGLSLWAIQFVRVDTGNKYLTRVFKGQQGERWECDCPAQTYRKRSAPAYKHCQAGAALRAWLTSFLEPIMETNRGRSYPTNREESRRAI